MNNKIKKYSFIFFICLAFLSVVGCSSDDSTPEEVKPELKTLTTDVNKLEFIAKGSVASVAVTTEANKWAIATDATWIQLSKSAGTKGTSLVSITALENPTLV